MDRREKEIEREGEREACMKVTVCDELVTAVTHCNDLHFTESVQHGTNIPFLKYRHTDTHAHTLTHYGPTVHVCHQQGSTSGFIIPGYDLYRYFNALIYTFTDDNTFHGSLLQRHLLWLQYLSCAAAAFTVE